MALLWPTATSTDAKSSARHGYMIEGNAGTTLLDAARGWTPDSAHWPTPDASVANDGEGVETFLVRKAHHAAKENPTRAGIPLSIAVQWATPRATEGEKGGPNGRDGSGSAHLASQAATWPTPVANDGKGAQPVERPEGDDSLSTRVARSARGLVLNPVFVEALMGWPLGWTDPLRPSGPSVPFPPPPKGDWGTYLALFPGTEPAVPKVDRAEVPDGAPRTDRLRACGNGVVPTQAAAAIGELLGALRFGDAPVPWSAQEMLRMMVDGIEKDIREGRTSYPGPRNNVQRYLQGAPGVNDEQVQMVQGGSARPAQDLRRVQEQVACGARQGSRGDEPRHAVPGQELRTLPYVHPTSSLCSRGREDVRGLRQGRLCLRGADANAGTEADAVNTAAPRASVRGWRNRWRST